MDQKTPMAFQDQCWKAGAEGRRNWRWINLLPCELPPPSFCPDWTILLDALFLLKIVRVWGLPALVPPSCRPVLYLNICGVSLVPLGLKGAGLSDACRTLAPEAALQKRRCSPWSCRGGGRRSWCWRWLKHMRSGDLPNTAGLMPAPLWDWKSAWSGRAYSRNPLWGTSVCLQAHEPVPNHTRLLGFHSLQSSRLYPQFKTWTSPPHFFLSLYK